MKQKLKYIIILFMPSKIGMSLYILSGFLVLVLNLILLNVFRHRLFNEILLVVNLMFRDFNSQLNHYINSRYINDTVDLVFWILVGCSIYILGKLFISDLNNLIESVELRKFIWPNKNYHNNPLKLLIEQTILKITIAILLILYLFNIVGKVLIYQLQTINYALNRGIISYIIASVVWLVQYIFLSHILIILIRLFLLKKRLFSTN